MRCMVGVLDIDRCMCCTHLLLYLSMHGFVHRACMMSKQGGTTWVHADAHVQRVYI